MKWFITGGAGFIGSNAVCRALERGHEVVVFDNLSRTGSARNLEWLRTLGEFEFIPGDVRNPQDLHAALAQHRAANVLLHLAAQVAVTTSVQDPRTDFEINALGTFNVLESVRNLDMLPVIINASTNKVYGALSDVGVREYERRYALVDLPGGVPETRSIDFHSPYGCSKGCADQYVIDYARIYGLRTVNFRQSCIYGYRQFGVEDQGWVAWFIIASLTGRPITIYGNGKQVRDVLFVDDLVDAYWTAVENIDRVSGQTFNIGGGPKNSISLLEFLDIIEELLGRKVSCGMADWRPGDQPIYVSDLHRINGTLGWRPKTSVRRGVKLLFDWVQENLDLFHDMGAPNASLHGKA
jgi:CDP-paratose 2-epimerase